MADLFFALSASLFLLSAQEGKTLEGEQPLLDRKPDINALAHELDGLEKVAAELRRDLASLHAKRLQLDAATPPAEPAPAPAPSHD